MISSGRCFIIYPCLVLVCFSSSCVPSRFQTPTDSLVLKEGQSSSTQEEIFQVSPAAAPPLSVHQSQEPVWIEGVRPPFGADSSSHMRLDSLQVQMFLMLDRRRSSSVRRDKLLKTAFHEWNSYLKANYLFTQNAAVYSARVQSPGRYIFILHYHQPLHPTYPVQVYINGGRIWQGWCHTSFRQFRFNLEELCFILGGFKPFGSGETLQGQKKFPS